MKICYLLEKAGPYHIFRLNALQAHPRSELSVIETQPCSGTYSWKEKPGIDFTIALMEENTYSALAEILELKLPDVIILTGYGFKEMLWAMAWAVRNSVPVVMQSDSTYEDQPRIWLKEQIKHFLLSHIQAAFVAGKRSSSYLQKLGIRSTAIFTPYDIIDNAFFSGTDRTDSPVGSPYFLCVSRLIPAKNLRFLIKSFSRFLESDYNKPADLKLIILGDGPLEDSLREQIQQHNLTERIILKGFVHMDEVRNYYQHSIALVLASISEPWGLCLNEAIAAGLPVITTNLAGAADDLIVDGISGYLFSPDDEGQLLSKLQQVLQLTKDTRSELTENAAKNLENYSITNFIDGLTTAARFAQKKPYNLWLRTVRSTLIKLIAKRTTS